MVSEVTYRRRLAENNHRRKARGHAGEPGQRRRIASMNARQLDRLDAKLRDCRERIPAALACAEFQCGHAFSEGRGEHAWLVDEDRKRIDGDLALIAERRAELASVHST